MKEEKIKKLEKELKYLLKSERDIEINKYVSTIEDSNVKELAKTIYAQRGIDYNALDKGIVNNLTTTINDFFDVFKGKEKSTRNKMIIEIVYIVLILILLKIPFDLVRDIGYDYIALISENAFVSTLWELAFLLLYTITIICTFIILVRNFNSKYKNIK